MEPPQAPPPPPPGPDSSPPPPPPPPPRPPSSAAAWIPGASAFPPPPPENNSGQGKSAIPPREVSGRWNWSAFLFPTVFAGMNRLWLWLAIAAAPLVLLGFDIVPPQVASLAGLGAWLGPGIYLGIKGNGLAWQKRHWQSVGQFCRVQRRWAWGSLAALIALSALGVYAGIQDPPQASDEPITFGEHGIAFEVPAGWSYDASGRFLTGMEGLRSSTLWMDAFYQGGGDGLIVIAAIDVGEEVQRSDLEEVSSALASGFGPDATLQGETQTLEIDGRPAFKLFVSTRTPDGDESESELVMVFEGRTGIMLKCQYTSADSAPALRACDRITQTLDVKDPQALASPSSQPD